MAKGKYLVILLIAVIAGVFAWQYYGKNKDASKDVVQEQKGGTYNTAMGEMGLELIEKAEQVKEEANSKTEALTGNNQNAITLNKTENTNTTDYDDRDKTESEDEYQETDDYMYEGDSSTDSDDGSAESGSTDSEECEYTFRSKKLLNQHWEKHGDEFDYEDIDEYVAGANRVINNPDSLHKIESEDGDDVYYLEETTEFVVVSTDGYIRTYFRPSSGISYFNRK
ncbi:MAG: hypothetical protein K6F84_00560 [Lachnospiraceae bacterium]|nr:hypothetical protein [Lachnospiraceae bacterium]